MTRRLGSTPGLYESDNADDGDRQIDGGAPELHHAAKPPPGRRYLDAAKREYQGEIERERRDEIDRAQRDRLLGDRTVGMEELREERRVEDKSGRIGSGDRQPLDDRHTRAGCDRVSHGRAMRAQRAGSQPKEIQGTGKPEP